MVVRAVGVTFENRQEHLARIEARREDWTVGIRREPDNPYDPNALAIMARNSGGEELHLGYLRRELSARWKSASGFIVTRWTVIGGGGRNYGLELNVIPTGLPVDLNASRQKELAKQVAMRFGK